MQDGLFKSIPARGLLHDPWHPVRPSPKFLMPVPVFALTSHLNSYIETSISHLAGVWFIHFKSETLDIRPQASLIFSANPWFPVFWSHSAYSNYYYSAYCLIFCTRRYLRTDKQQFDILYGFLSFLHKEFITVAGTTSCWRLPEDPLHLLTLSSVENTKVAGAVTPLCPVNSWNLGSQALQAEVRSHQQM